MFCSVKLNRGSVKLNRGSVKLNTVNRLVCITKIFIVDFLMVANNKLVVLNDQTNLVKYNQNCEVLRRSCHFLS
jgi:hypothetical protein